MWNLNDTSSGLITIVWIIIIQEKIKPSREKKTSPQSTVAVVRRTWVFFFSFNVFYYHYYLHPRNVRAAKKNYTLPYESLSTTTVVTTVTANCVCVWSWSRRTERKSRRKSAVPLKPPSDAGDFSVNFFYASPARAFAFFSFRFVFLCFS